MLTPQEVAQQSFTKASFGGYNMAMVDDFLDQVTKDYETLFNENALLKQKLGVLSGKIREYQSTEEAMRKTLLAAQQMSDSLKRDTEAQCAQLLADAERQASERVKEINAGLSSEAEKLENAKKSVQEYKDKIRDACRAQLEFLQHLDDMTPVTDANVRVDEAMEDISAAVARSVAEEEAQEAAASMVDFGIGSGPGTEEDTREMPTVGTGRVTPPTVVEESSVSLYEQLMAQRRAGEDSEAPQKPGRRELEFGKDFKID